MIAAVDTVLRPIFEGDGFAAQGLAIPDQAFAAIFVPVGEDPALDVNAVDDMVVLGWLVCVAVNEGRVTVLTQKVIGRRGLQVGVGIFLAALAGFADFAHVGSDGATFGERFGQQGRLPFRIAYLGTEGNIGSIVKAKRIAVREYELPFSSGQDLRVVQQLDAGCCGEPGPEQKIAIAVHGTDL